MLYLIMIEDAKNIANICYHLYETRSESLLYGNKKFVISLLSKYKMKAKNFCIRNGQIEIKKWPHEIKKSSEKYFNTRSDYTLLTSINEQRYKLVNYSGLVYYFDAEELMLYIRLDKIANCDFTSGIKAIYTSIDTYSVHSESSFEKLVASKYTEFMARALMLGVDMGFKYEIAGKDVKLIRYTGTSKRVILPNFITTINSGVFKYGGIEEVFLRDGLEYIGNEAFMNNNLSHIEIPKTIQFIGEGAFHNNKGLLDKDNNLDKSKVKLMNSKALIIGNLV